MLDYMDLMYIESLSQWILISVNWVTSPNPTSVRAMQKSSDTLILIAKKQKSDIAIPIHLWPLEVSNCVPLEKLSYW